MGEWAWLCAIGALVLIGALVYWQIAIAEGAYLGRRVVIWLYDRWAPRYDAVKQFNPAADDLLLAAPILIHTRTTPRPRVLDLACGTGRLSEALLRQPLFRGEIVALDASARMLEIARRKLAAHSARVQFIQHPAETLPFGDAEFDAVACVEALEFLPDPRAAIREMLRVLKPGGFLLLSNRVGPDAWKLPGRTTPTPTLIAWLTEQGLQRAEPQTWLVDYDLIYGIKSR